MMRLRRRKDDRTESVNAELDKNVKELDQVTQELKEVAAVLAVKAKEFSNGRKV